MSARLLDRRSFFVTLAAATIICGRGDRAYAAGEDNNALYAGLLRNYVSADADGINRVDYARWHASKSDRDLLAHFIESQSNAAPSSLPRNAAFAYWANLYNSLTLKVVLDHYPVKSIRDIRSETSLLDLKGLIGPWRTKLVAVEGKMLSLDDIEHTIMRPTFHDPRVHYAVNCASIGCPNLRQTPWQADTLNDSLDAAARAYVNHPRGAFVRADGKLKISSIYHWFKQDFGGNDDGILQHLRRYAEGPLLKRLEAGATIAEDDYDWRLNRKGASLSQG